MSIVFRCFFFSQHTKNTEQNDATTNHDVTKLLIIIKVKPIDDFAEGLPPDLRLPESLGYSRSQTLDPFNYLRGLYQGYTGAYKVFKSAQMTKNHPNFACTYKQKMLKFYLSTTFTEEVKQIRYCYILAVYREVTYYVPSKLSI